MARVFLAVSRGPAGFNKLVVVKVVKRELLSDPDFVTMFLDEARLAARLNHPNVVQTYEVGEEDGHYFLTMEFLDGQPLSEMLLRLERHDMPLREHLWILTRVLSGLHYAHEIVDFDGTPLAVVHRDVSPANVFVTYDGAVKLVDFGVAKAAGALAVTQKGMFKGKFGYGAPEQMLEQAIDRRADLFSVGVMLWEALAEKSFAAGRGLEPLVSARVSGRDPRIRDVVPDVDPALSEICDRAMALRPEDRFPTAVDFRDELERYLDGCEGRVGARDVAQLITDAFEVDRSEMRQSIEVSIRRPEKKLLDPAAFSPATHDYASLSVSAWPEEAIIMPPTPPSATASDELSAGASGPVTEPSAGVPSPPPASNDSQVQLSSAPEPVATPNTVGGITVGAEESLGPNVPRETTHPSAGTKARTHKRSPVVPLAVVTITGAVIGASIVLISAESSDSAGADGAPLLPASVAVAPGHDGVSVTSSAHPAGQIETVNLYVVAIPSDATIRLDGRRVVGNPFSASVPRGRITHVVRAEAPGFVADERVVAFTQDVTVELELDPVSARRPSAPTAPGFHPTATEALRPGSYLRPPEKPAKPSRTIDERDPWSR